MFRSLWPGVLMLLISQQQTPAGEELAPGELSPTAETPVRFAIEIEPLFRKHCISCHGAEKQEAGLRLDVRSRALAGGDGGKVIVAGRSAASRLVLAVAGTEPEIGRMPPDDLGQPLTNEQIGLLRAWIDQGADWPAETDKTQRAAHWSFEPMQLPIPPDVANPAWLQNAVDSFVLKQLDERAIAPSKMAGPETWFRRVHLDLLGLLSPVEDLTEFLSNTLPDRHEQVIDRLLASPAYGERWGRHWLDLARYADSDGYEKDKPRPFAWRYRQWVIEAVNADLPFDRFSIAQLAGDLLPGPSMNDLVATGFQRNTLHNTEGGADPEEDRVKKTVDRTNTAGTIWLGLTLACAQCHSHKYDPISQREYYSIYAFFNSLTEVDVDAPTAAERREIAGEESGQQSPRLPAAPKAQTVTQLTPPRPTNVQIRGDFLSPGEIVEPSGLSVLPPLAVSDRPPDRRDLAQWLFDDAHPLTARVAANRIWQHLFLRGIVATEDDFGSQGERPSHPELLDWLARNLRDGGWSAKRLQRLLLLSATYGQASAPRADLMSSDPENAWLARQTRRRVEAELIRDLALDASGLLDRRLGGPSVHPRQPSEHATLTYANSVSWTNSTGGDAHRRGLYTFFQRTSPFPMLSVFDAPDSNECCVRRAQSNTPLQALTLWNDPLFVEMSQQLARRIAADDVALGEGIPKIESQARYAVRLCLGREAFPNEISEISRLYEWHLEQPDDPTRIAAIIGESNLPLDQHRSQAAWVFVARVLLNLDEFITRE